MEFESLYFAFLLLTFKLINSQLYPEFSNTVSVSSFIHPIVSIRHLSMYSNIHSK